MDETQLYNSLKTKVKELEELKIQTKTKLASEEEVGANLLKQLTELGFKSVEELEQYIQKTEQEIKEKLQLYEAKLNGTYVEPTPTPTPTPTPAVTPLVQNPISAVGSTTTSVPNQPDTIIIQQTPTNMSSRTDVSNPLNTGITYDSTSVPTPTPQEFTTTATSSAPVSLDSDTNLEDVFGGF